MAGEQSLIDQIVNGVLKQLGTAGGDDAHDATSGGRVRSNADGPVAANTAKPTRQGTVELADTVITADLLSEQIGQAGTVAIPKKSIITPAAWDVIRQLGIEVQRPARVGEEQSKSAVSSASGASTPTATGRLLIVVRHTDAVDRLWQDLQSSWRRELLGCPDDAAKLAISELSRGETASVVILAEQSHRAACLANRHEHVKAAAIRDAAEVKAIGKQMKTNVWCIDPTGRSWFELRNLFRAIG